MVSLGGLVENYTYDPLYQLTQVTQGLATSESYSYDAVGNRLSSQGMSPYAYNSSNELTSTPSATFTYDANGNTLTKVDSSGTTTYGWDFENRLTSVALPSGAGTVTFKYDPFRRRIQKNSSSSMTNYLYQGGNTVEEVDQTGAELAHYSQTGGIDDALAAVRGGAVGFYEQDGLLSVTSLTGSTGTVLNSFSYDAFGNLASSTGSFVNPFLYTGRDYDPETGLRYYRARYYDPSTGRFLSEDPMRFVGGINSYRYVGNDPVNFADPTGLKECLLDPKSRCATLFQKVLGMSPKQFNDLADKIPWFLSPNQHTLDPLDWNDIARNGDHDLISSDLTGPEAITASPGGMSPAPVVLGPDWFLDTPARQSAVKLHEAVHSITGHPDAWIFAHFKPYGLPDYEYQNFLGSTDEFTRWLLAGCPKKGVK